MAITITLQKPQVWMPASNPIIWSFLSNQLAQPNFNYVIDVYIAAPTFPAVGFPTLRLIQKPNPSGYCMVDVSNIVQSYLSLSNFYGTEVGVASGPTYARYGNLQTAGLNLWNATAEVYLRIGERYDVGSAPIIFNGLGATGAPAYTAYANYVGIDLPVKCVPAALSPEVSIPNIMATNISTSFYAPFIMDGNGLFLTRAGTTQSIMRDQHHSVSFLNQWDAAPGSFAYSVQGMQVIYYNSAGVSIGSFFYQNTTGNGGGPQTADSYTSVLPGTNTNILQFNCGTSLLNPPALTAYYTVQAFRKTSATPLNTPGAACSALYRFNIVSPPCSDLYPVVRVAWLNDIGGRDYYNFTMLYEKSTVSEGESWYQTDVNWDGQYPYSSTISGDWFLSGGPKTFNKSVTTRFVLQTDWLLQEEIDFLGQIPESSQTWAYIGTGTNMPVSIQVTNLEYTYSNIKQQKLVQVTLECEHSKIQPKQNL